MENKSYRRWQNTKHFYYHSVIIIVGGENKLNILKKKKRKNSRNPNLSKNFKQKHSKTYGTIIVLIFITFLIGVFLEDTPSNGSDFEKVVMENITLDKNESILLNFENGINLNKEHKNFSCLSSDTQVAQVINSKVFALSQGEVSIRCKLGNQELEPFIVTVTDQSSSENKPILSDQPSSSTDSENQNNSDNSTSETNSPTKPNVNDSNVPTDSTANSPPNNDISNNNSEESINTDNDKDNDQIIDKPQNNTSSSGRLLVSFIDVGQGDSILIETPNNKTILIDAGTSGYSTKIENYLKSRGISKIDVLIGTHPHADHIGGMVHIINTFTIGSIYMPNVSSTTQTFENLLLTIQNKGMTINTAKSGVSINVDNSVQTNFIAPVSTYYSDINQYSAVLKVTYNSTSFLFTGDAGQTSENEMLNSGTNLKADVLKVGHHGSSTSTTQSFLNSVSPKYAVITVGNNNRYGHPHDAVIERLNSMNVNIFRTDLNGTIVMSSDGQNIKIE